MSRHEQKTEDGWTIVVGWDPPLETYFGQVIAPEPEGPCLDPACEVREHLGEHDLSDCQDNDPKVWVGYGAAAKDEISTVDQLAERLGEHGRVARFYQVALEADRQANPRTERAPAIQAMLDKIAEGF
jgi:hypothetical protein